MTDAEALSLALVVQIVVLHRGSRRLLAVPQRRLSRVLTYLLAFPGTVLHEGAHLLACVALGVRVGRVRLFRPERREDGSVVLGGIAHAPTDPARQAAISLAPLLLIPPLLALVTTLLLGTGATADLPDSLSAVAPWRVALWAYVALSCGQAAFPSPGDHIGVRGALAVAVVLAGATCAILAFAGGGALTDVLGALVGMLAIPAGAAGAGLAVLGLRRRLATRPRLRR